MADLSDKERIARLEAIVAALCRICMDNKYPFKEWGADLQKFLDTLKLEGIIK